MKSSAVIVLFTMEGDQILLCKRNRPPYAGLYDFIGGACTSTENAQACALRKLFEETGIGERDVQLTHVMDFAYYTTQTCVQVFTGCVSMHTPLTPSGHSLHWVPVTSDFADASAFAGEGYIEHILSHIRSQTLEDA